MKKRFPLILLPVLLLSVQGFAQQLPSDGELPGDQPPADKPVVVEPSIVGRLRSINILIHASSVVRRIEISGNETALALLSEARALYAVAVSQHQTAQDDEAGKTLNQVVAKLMAASRAAKSSLEDAGYQLRLYNERLNSVQALIAAHHRVAADKGIAAEKSVIEDEARAWVAQAQAQVGQGKIPEGQILLNKAYITVKASIFSMHNGDTVSNPKHFANAQEEYAYEKDRAQSYRMLIFVLIGDKGADARTVADIERYTGSGDELVRQAEEQAQTGDYSRAIGTIISASRLYARAIRAGGIYIPD